MSNLKSLLVIGLLGAHAFVAYEAQAGDAVATAPTKAQKAPSSLRVTFPAQTSTAAHDKDWIHIESYTWNSAQVRPKPGIATRQAAPTETLDIAHTGFLDEPASAPAPRRNGTVVTYNFTQAWPSAAPAPRMPPTVTMKRGTNNAGE